MSSSFDTGRAGEQAAADFLLAEGFELRDRNWRNGPYELDIVAQRDGVLHIVEVKTRRLGGLQPPEAAATPRKFRSLTRAASRYLALQCWRGEVQFDLAAVDVLPGGELEVRLIEQAMEYNW